MSSRVSNIKTYFNKFSREDSNFRPEASTIGLVKQRAESEGVNIADDGRGYAAFKRPPTKAQMRAMNAKKK